MNNTRPAIFNSSRHQKGVNLIEIMVSMVIGLFLVLGATTLYVRSKKTSDVDDSIARVQETARYAMSVLEADIRMANYWGFSNDSKTINNAKATESNNVSNWVPSASLNLCGNSYSIDVLTPITGTNNTYSLTCTASPTSAAPSADTLTIRRANSANWDPATATTTINTSDATTLEVCAKPAATYLVYNSNPSDAFPCAAVLPLIVHAYYVDQGSDQSTMLPSLRRKVLTAGPAFTDQEVIPGVEDMQIQLGWSSTANSQIPIQFLQPGNPGTGQVVAVRIWLLVRSERPDFTFTDTRTYSYGDRDTANGTVSSLASAGAANKAYAPNDNFRRVMVSRTYYVRNAGT